MKSLTNKTSILIINTFGIGDVLFTTPIIELLKNKYPEADIGYLCNRRTEEIVSANPNIDNIFVYEKDEFRALWKESWIKCVKSFFDLWARIRKNKYSIVFDFSFSREFGLLLFVLGFPIRIGYDYKGRGIFLNRKKDLLGGYKDKHIIDYYMELLTFAGFSTVEKPEIKFYIPQNNENETAKLLKNNGIEEDEKFIAIVPGGGNSWGKTAFRKQWPIKNFVKLAQLLIEKFGLKIVLLGSESDKKLCDIIEKNAGSVINLCGMTSILTLGAVIRRAQLLITNDGGPLHIGVGVGTKTLSIFGPVDERVYGPYPLDSEKNIVVKYDNLRCRPCYKNFKLTECESLKCLEDISVESVFKMVEKLLL